jgi:hypothetical protein
VKLAQREHLRDRVPAAVEKRQFRNWQAVEKRHINYQ